MKRTIALSMASILRTARAVAPLAIVLLVAGVAAACPTCTDGLAQNDPHGKSLAAGFYYSILFMMSMPYLVLATLGCIAYLSVRRARLASAATDVCATACEAPLSAANEPDTARF